MPNRVEKCPLCNFEVALSSNHPHNYSCPNLHRPFSQWLTTASGYPSQPHPDAPPVLDEEDDGLTSNLLSGLFGSNDTSSQEPDTSTPDTPAPDFGGSNDGFAGGGGGDSW